MKNDFLERLANEIDTIDGVNMTSNIGSLGMGEGLSVYALPGGEVVGGDMSGARDVKLPFEIAIKSKSQSTSNDTLWLINQGLGSIDIDIPSANDSYEFESLEVGTPFLNEEDDQGYFLYLLDVTANIRTY